jgi:glycosyltransferase involved in cell wall biosynthesis
MKLAIFASSFRPILDGVAISVHERAKRLAEQGNEVMILAPDYRCVKQYFPDVDTYMGRMLPGVEVVSLVSRDFAGMEYERTVAFGSYGRARDALERFRPDAIHVDEPERMYLGFLRRAGLAYARERGIPCTAQYHTNYVDYGDDYLAPWLYHPLRTVVSAVFGKAFNAYDLTMVSSDAALERARSLGVTNTLRVDVCGLDAACFHPRRRTRARGEGRVRMVFLGRLAPDKGWAFTLQAMDALAKSVNLERTEWVVAGPGPMRNEVEEALAKSVRHLHFPGPVPPEGVPELLANADVYVTASEKETRGLTVLEALASGVPVLAPRAGAIPDIVVDGHNGVLHPPRDTDAFVTGFRQLVEDRPFRDTLAERTRPSVEHLDWDLVVRNWLEVIERLANERALR